MSAKLVRFPTTRSLGKVHLSNYSHPSDWFEYSDARGEVVIPPGCKLMLHISNEALTDLTPLTDLAPDALYAIDFNNTKVKDEDLFFVQSLIHLHGIALWETDVGNLALEHIAKLTSMQWLDLGDTRVTDEGLTHLRGMERLQSLTLLNTRISDNGLISLAELKCLQHLDLMSTRVSDISVASLSAMTSLRYLRIYQTLISEAGHAEISRALTDCEVWYFRSNDL